MAMQEQPTALPPAFRSKLRSLFNEIEKEFELLYLENLQLQGRASGTWETASCQASEKASAGDAAELDGLRQKKQKVSQQSSLQRVKAATKIRAQTSKIVSSFKGTLISTNFAKEFTGHRDGVWDVTCPRSGQPFIGTASADHTAGVWSTSSGACILKYTGHSGSVNSIRFHPTKEVVLTASGDTTAHIWQADMGTLPLEPESDDPDCLDDKTESPTLRTPRFELKGHSNVVIAADWLSGGDQVITASWDRTACLYDANTGESVHSLSGHDQELTHIHAHTTQPLVVTSSKDCTFRLWDFRETKHSVSVFQGHTESVTCSVFAQDKDKVVSSSEDRTVKVWDLRNMSSPLVTIRNDSSVNWVAVSPLGTVAVPSDNRQVRFFDLEGQRLGRLSRSGRQGHRRMVCSVAWAEDNQAPINFFTAGFDRLVLGWSVQPCKDLVSR